MGKQNSVRSYQFALSAMGAALVLAASSIAYAEPAPTCSIWANTSSVPYGGSATVTWDSWDASSANLETVGNVPTRGSRTLNDVRETRAYKLNVYGSGGASSGNCQVTIHVGSPNYGDPYYRYNYPYSPYIPSYLYPQYGGANNPPSCTITLSPDTSGYPQSWVSTYGYPMLLKWSATNATSASISPDIGSVSTQGSRTVYVRGQQFSMSVYGPGGTSVCHTAAYTPTTLYGSGYPFAPYANAPLYTYPAYQPSAASAVALSQIPYTGADFGLLGNLLMWLSIVLVGALGAGYLAHRAGFAPKLIAEFTR